MNPELASLYEADLNAHRQSMPDHENNRRRLARVQELLANGVLQEPVDQFRAAMILHNGETAEDLEQACRLARLSFDGGYEHARKLVALTLDRWLTYQGKPQKFGTQYMHDEAGWRLIEYDPTTTDEERAEWEVPPLAELLETANQLNRPRRHR